MKFRIKRSERANGKVFWQVEKKGFIFWNTLDQDHRKSFHREPGKYESRERALAVIDFEISEKLRIAKLDKGNEIIAVSIEIIEK